MTRVAAIVLGGLLLACSHARPTDPLTQPYPFDVSLERLEGGRLRLASLRGEVTVVTFFATWCMPCLVEIPYLREVHARPSVSVVAVSLDSVGREVLEPFVRRFEVDYPVVLADAAVLEGRSPFGAIPGIPASFLLDRDGKLVAAVLGGLAPDAFDPLLEDVVEGRRRGVTPESPSGR